MIRRSVCGEISYFIFIPFLPHEREKPKIGNAEKGSQMVNKHTHWITSQFNQSLHLICIFSFFFLVGLMIRWNAKHLSKTMVVNKHRIKSLSDPFDIIQHSDALEYLDGKSVVIEIQFSRWSISSRKGRLFYISEYLDLGFGVATKSTIEFLYFTRFLFEGGCLCNYVIYTSVLFYVEVSAEKWNELTIINQKLPHPVGKF